MTEKANNSLIVMDRPQITPDLQINNFPQLNKESLMIKNKYQNVIGSVKTLRDTKRRLNKLKRNLNDFRKAKARPTRKQLKAFKGKIDILCDNINVPIQNINKRLKFYNSNDAERLIKSLQPEMDQICESRHIKPIQLPVEAFKKSYSHRKCVDVMVGIADTVMQRDHLINARDINGKAVYADANGEMHTVGIARKMTFLGSKLQLQGLLKYIQKHNIVLRVGRK